MAQEDQLPVINLSSGLSTLEASPSARPGTCADTYTAGNTFQKSTLYYKATIHVFTYDALFTFFTDPNGAMTDEITLKKNMVYEFTRNHYGGKIKNQTAGSNATYEIWWEK